LEHFIKFKRLVFFYLGNEPDLKINYKEVKKYPIRGRLIKKTVLARKPG